MEVDVLIIGSGAAGLSTAVVAAKHGLSVLVVEKSNYFGGTTAYSLGAPWIIDNKHQQTLNLEDSPEKGEQYLRQTLGNLYDADKVSAYIESGKDMVAFMESQTEVRWDGIPMPDYFPEAQGAAFGRTMLTRAYDGRRLGKKYLNQIRRPLPGFSVFGDMQVDPREAVHLTNGLKNKQAFFYSAKKVLTYIKDKIVYGRGAYLANGNALVGALMKSALDTGVQFWRSAPATRLITENNGVVGAVVQREGVAVTITATKGVVLASGGFGANPELRAKYIPLADSHISVQPDENNGDGIRIGRDAGGALGAVNPENGVWAPVSVMVNKDGSVAKYPHFGPDRGKPGSIIVDSSGKRFANEAAPYQTFVNIMQKNNITTAYFIGDHKFLRSYGMGFALPAPYPIGRFVNNGYLIKARTLAALATKLGINPQTMAETVSVFNTHAKDGVDPDFNRGANVYDNSQGDFNHTPNPNLAPLSEGPFYAVAIHPGDVSTVLGMETTVDAQVVTEEGAVMDGLYAVGLDQNSVMRGVYPGGGSGIGPGMTFGYRAAKHMAAKS